VKPGKGNGMRVVNLVSRRDLLVAAASVAAAGWAPSLARAQAAWPTERPIKMIVPFSPGASTDTLARYVANVLAARLGQAIVVENKVGAGGAIGTAYVAGQPADGYTLLFQTNPFVSAPMLIGGNKKPPYDPEKDLQPIGEVGTAPLMVVVANDLQATTLRGFLDLARARPAGISYGSAGVGTINHLAAELLASMARIKLLHVPYKGLGPAITDLLGGNVQMIVASFPSVLSHVRAGKMRALAVTGAQRSQLVPELPTVAEAGLSAYEIEAWWGLLGPAGLPAAVVKRLNDELAALLMSPASIELLARDGAIPRPGRPEDFGNMIHADVPRWRKLIQEAHITAD
jgi:tripartite-type tricarboxylate transporter receptor subunit TctC